MQRLLRGAGTLDRHQSLTFLIKIPATVKKKSRRRGIMHLKNQVAIVTGRAGGLGAGICDALTEEGTNMAKVVNQNVQGD